MATRAQKYPNTKWFRLFNANPKNRFTDDCVVRAICTATGQPYETILRKLCEVSINTGYSVNSKNVIIQYLDKILCNDTCAQPKHTNGKKFTGKEFCEAHPVGNYVCMIGGHHVVAVIDGKINDTWDCSDKCVGNFWRIKFREECQVK